MKTKAALGAVRLPNGNDPLDSMLLKNLFILTCLNLYPTK